MFRLFNGQTADDVWQQVAKAFRNDDGVLEQQSRAGPTREILRAAISIHNPRQRWVTSRIPPINPAFAIAETVWIMNGRNDAEFLNYFNRSLPRFAGTGEIYHGAYGYRLRRHLGIDQLERAYLALSRKPDSRQVVLQIWDGRIDLPEKEGEEANPDVACNVVSMLKIRRGALEWTQVMRSNDVFRGLPYNIVQFTTLHEVISGWLGVSVGTYNQISDSLHVYRDCIDLVLGYTPVKPEPNQDSLVLPKQQSEDAFAELARMVDIVIDPAKTSKKLISLVAGTSLPEGFRNMLCVLCAEGARRRRTKEAVRAVMDYCTNPIYRQLFDQWCKQLEAKKRNGESVTMNVL